MKAVPAVGVAEKVADEQLSVVRLAEEVVATSVFSQAIINNAILIVKLNNTFLDFINLICYKKVKIKIRKIVFQSFPIRSQMK